MSSWVIIKTSAAYASVLVAVFAISYLIGRLGPMLAPMLMGSFIIVLALIAHKFSKKDVDSEKRSFYKKRMGGKLAEIGLAALFVTGLFFSVIRGCTFGYENVYDTIEAGAAPVILALDSHYQEHGSYPERVCRLSKDYGKESPCLELNPEILAQVDKRMSYNCNEGNGYTLTVSFGLPKYSYRSDKKLWYSWD